MMDVPDVDALKAAMHHKAAADAMAFDASGCRNPW